MLRAEGWPDDVEVDLWLCADDEIHELNRQYREKDRPTDVLSFPQFEPGDRPGAEMEQGIPVVLGDVVISVDTAAKQAAERGVSLGQEIAWLWLHSLLHLIGYNDDTEEGLEQMIDKATVILSSTPA